MKSFDDAAEFHRFFEEHHRTLARLAYLLVGDAEAADDLTADAFIATWRRWDRVTADDRPLVSVRRNVLDLAARRARSVTRERGQNGPIRAEAPVEVLDEGEPAVPVLSGLRSAGPSGTVPLPDIPYAPGLQPEIPYAPGLQPDASSAPDRGPDTPPVPGLRVTLRRLPPRRRACVALRCAFDLPEAEIAETVGVSARLAAKEIARGVAAFEKALDARRSPRARGGTSGSGARANQPPDWLRFALYREAHAHEPDRARMRSRVAAALRARVTRRARVRMVAAGGAAVAVAAVAVVTLPRITGSNEPAASDGGALSPAAPDPLIPQPNGSAQMMGRPGRPNMGVAHRVDGRENGYWSQDLVDVTSDRPLTDLRVTLRIARTSGAKVSGSWLSLSPEDFVITSATTGRTLVYQWSLKPGHTVPTGTITFAAQYQHTPHHRDLRKDLYSVTASGGAGKPVTADGHF